MIQAAFSCQTHLGRKYSTILSQKLLEEYTRYEITDGYTKEEIADLVSYLEISSGDSIDRASIHIYEFNPEV